VDGGGIFNAGGTVTIRQSVIKNNHPNDRVGF
jgi:hypothetical protein